MTPVSDAAIGQQQRSTTVEGGTWTGDDVDLSSTAFAISAAVRACSSAAAACEAEGLFVCPVLSCPVLLSCSKQASKRSAAARGWVVQLGVSAVRGHSWGVESGTRRVTAQDLTPPVLQSDQSGQQQASGLEDGCGSLQALYLAICHLWRVLPIARPPAARCPLPAARCPLCCCWGAVAGVACAGVVPLGGRWGGLCAGVGLSGCCDGVFLHPAATLTVVASICSGFPAPLFPSRARKRGVPRLRRDLLDKAGPPPPPPRPGRH